LISNEEAGRQLLAFDLQEPWSCHQIYRIFDELHGRVFGRPEVNAGRIILINEIMKLIRAKLGDFSNRSFAHYTLTRFFLLHVIALILLQDATSKNLILDPSSLLKKRTIFKKFLDIVNQILTGVVIELNYEATQLGDAFDYKVDLKNQTRVKDLAGPLIKQHEKEIARGRISTFSVAWAG
jgi:hypothetical protein